MLWHSKQVQVHDMQVCTLLTHIAPPSIISLTERESVRWQEAQELPAPQCLCVNKPCTVYYQRGLAQQHTPRDYTSDKPCACMVPALHSGQNNKRMPACLPARPPHAHTTILLYCLCAGVYLPVSTRTEQMVQEKIIFRTITINLIPLYVPVSWKRVTDTITLHQNLVPPKPACYLCHQERERKKKTKKPSGFQVSEQLSFKVIKLTLHQLTVTLNKAQHSERRRL